MNHPQTEQLEEQAAEERPQPPAQLACFIAQERVCGPDCMAYLTHPPEGKAYLGVQWAHCHLLVNADRGARHLAILTDIGGKLVAIARNEARAAKAPGVV